MVSPSQYPPRNNWLHDVTAMEIPDDEPELDEVVKVDLVDWTIEELITLYATSRNAQQAEYKNAILAWVLDEENVNKCDEKKIREICLNLKDVNDFIKVSFYGLDMKGYIINFYYLFTSKLLRDILRPHFQDHQNLPASVELPGVLGVTFDELTEGFWLIGKWLYNSKSDLTNITPQVQYAFFVLGLRYCPLAVVSAFKKIENLLEGLLPEQLFQLLECSRLIKHVGIPYGKIIEAINERKIGLKLSGVTEVFCLPYENGNHRYHNSMKLELPSQAELFIHHMNLDGYQFLEVTSTRQLALDKKPGKRVAEEEAENDIPSKSRRKSHREKQREPLASEEPPIDLTVTVAKLLHQFRKLCCLNLADFNMPLSDADIDSILHSLTLEFIILPEPQFYTPEQFRRLMQSEKLFRLTLSTEREPLPYQEELIECMKERRDRSLEVAIRGSEIRRLPNLLQFCRVSAVASLNCLDLTVTDDVIVEIGKVEPPIACLAIPSNSDADDLTILASLNVVIHLFRNSKDQSKMTNEEFSTLLSRDFRNELLKYSLKCTSVIDEIERSNRDLVTSADWTDLEAPIYSEYLVKMITEGCSVACSRTLITNLAARPSLPQVSFIISHLSSHPFTKQKCNQRDTDALMTISHWNPDLSQNIGFILLCLASLEKPRYNAPTYQNEIFGMLQHLFTHWNEVNFPHHKNPEQSVKRAQKIVHLAILNRLTDKQFEPLLSCYFSWMIDFCKGVREIWQDSFDILITHRQNLERENREKFLQHYTRIIATQFEISDIWKLLNECLMAGDNPDLPGWFELMPTLVLYLVTKTLPTNATNLKLLIIERLMVDPLLHKQVFPFMIKCLREVEFKFKKDPLTDNVFEKYAEELCDFYLKFIQDPATQELCYGIIKTLAQRQPGVFFTRVRGGNIIKINNAKFLVRKQSEDGEIATLTPVLFRAVCSFLANVKDIEPEIISTCISFCKMDSQWPRTSHYVIPNVQFVIALIDYFANNIQAIKLNPNLAKTVIESAITYNKKGLISSEQLETVIPSVLELDVDIQIFSSYFKKNPRYYSAYVVYVHSRKDLFYHAFSILQPLFQLLTDERSLTCYLNSLEKLIETQSNEKYLKTGLGQFKLDHWFVLFNAIYQQYVNSTNSDSITTPFPWVRIMNHTIEAVTRNPLEPENQEKVLRLLKAGITDYNIGFKLPENLFHQNQELIFHFIEIAADAPLKWAVYLLPCIEFIIDHAHLLTDLQAEKFIKLLMRLSQFKELSGQLTEENIVKLGSWRHLPDLVVAISRNKSFQISLPLQSCLISYQYAQQPLNQDQQQLCGQIITSSLLNALESEFQQEVSTLSCHDANTILIETVLEMMPRLNFASLFTHSKALCTHWNYFLERAINNENIRYRCQATIQSCLFQSNLEEATDGYYCYIASMLQPLKSEDRERILEGIQSSIKALPRIKIFLRESQLRMSPEYLRQPVVLLKGVSVLPMEEQRDLLELLDFYDEINWEDSTHPKYVDPELLDTDQIFDLTYSNPELTIDDIKPAMSLPHIFRLVLERFILVTTKNLSYTSAPEDADERREYFAPCLNLMQHLLRVYRTYENTSPEALVRIGRYPCASEWKTRLEEAYYSLDPHAEPVSNMEAADLDQAIAFYYFQKRCKTIDTAMKRHKYYQDTHHCRDFLSMVVEDGKRDPACELGLAEHPHATLDYYHVDKKVNPAVKQDIISEYRFFCLDNATPIIDEIFSHMDVLGAKFFAWFATQEIDPIEYQDEDTLSYTREAVYFYFTHLGILK